MYPSQHIFLGAFFSIILFLLFPQIGFIGAGLIFLSSFAIDVDHYLFYVYKKKDINFRKSRLWYFSRKPPYKKMSREQRNKHYHGFYFLHGLETVALLFLLGFLHRFFFFIFVGISFHLLLDYMEQPIFHDRIDKFSSIHDFLKFKKLKIIDGN